MNTNPPAPEPLRLLWKGYAKPDFRRCTRCGTRYPFTTEFFRADNRLPFGIQATCLACCRESYRRLRERKQAAAASA